MSTLVSRQHRLAIVTGGTSGIGLAIVKDLARDHHVLALGRNAESLAQLAEHPQVTPVAIDLLDHAALERLIAPLTEIDVLVHSAAISQALTTAQASADDWRRHLEVNLIAPAELTRLALPALRRARGQVVYINSGAGVRSVPGMTVYSASKHALRALADGVRIDEAVHGVRVSTVAPGPTDTPVHDRHPHEERVTGPDRRLMSSPESIAAGVRLVVDTTVDSQVTEVVIRPRSELG